MVCRDKQLMGAVTQRVTVQCDVAMATKVARFLIDKQHSGCDTPQRSYADRSADAKGRGRGKGKEGDLAGKCEFVGVQAEAWRRKAEVE